MKSERRTADEEANDFLKGLFERGRLASWDEYVEALEVPSDLIPAFITSRPELLHLAQPRAVTKEEHAKLIKLIGGLFETNVALRQHAERVSKQAGELTRQLKGINRLAGRIEHFANFRETAETEEE